MNYLFYPYKLDVFLVLTNRHIVYNVVDELKRKCASIMFNLIKPYKKREKSPEEISLIANHFWAKFMKHELRYI